MEALLVLAALIAVWLVGLLTLVWVVPAALAVLAAGAADRPSPRR